MPQKHDDRHWSSINPTFTKHSPTFFLPQPNVCIKSIRPRKIVQWPGRCNLPGWDAGIMINIMRVMEMWWRMMEYFTEYDYIYICIYIYSAHDWRTYVYVVKKNTPRLENHLAEFKVPLPNFNNGSGSKDDECRCATRVRRTRQSHLPFIGLNRYSRIMCIYDAYVIVWYCMCIHLYIYMSTIYQVGGFK